MLGIDWQGGVWHGSMSSKTAHAIKIQRNASLAFEAVLHCAEWIKFSIPGPASVLSRRQAVALAAAIS